VIYLEIRTSWKVDLVVTIVNCRLEVQLIAKVHTYLVGQVDVARPTTDYRCLVGGSGVKKFRGKLTTDEGSGVGCNFAG
jgi:hypothetical protein